MFDDVVGRYDLLNGLLSFGLDRRWRLATARAVRSSPGEHVLDLGCGTGDLSLILARSGAKVIGIDLSAGMLAEAQRKTRGRTVRLVRASAFELPFPDATFAGAASGFVRTYH